MRVSISKILLTAVLSISFLTGGVALHNNVAKNGVGVITHEYNLVSDLPDALAT